MGTNGLPPLRSVLSAIGMPHAEQSNLGRVVCFESDTPEGNGGWDHRVIIVGTVLGIAFDGRSGKVDLTISASWLGNDRICSLSCERGVEKWSLNLATSPARTGTIRWLA